MTAPTKSPPRALVTGAAGRVFQSIEPMLRRDIDYVLTDNAPSRDDIHQLDLLDFPAVRQALRDIDLVLHLAIYSKQKTPGLAYVEMNDRQIEVNVLGTQHLYEAAFENGVHHIAYMSSITTVIGAPCPPRFDRDTPYRASTVYGVTKMFGEMLSEVYARQRGMSVTCMRLAQPVPMYHLQWGTDAIEELIREGLAVGFSDIAQAVNVALAPRESGWRVFNVISQCDGVPCRFDLSAGIELGFSPQQMLTRDAAIDLPDAQTRTA
jgi:nucleoside-diphosphate-sugar epimerase